MFNWSKYAYLVVAHINNVITNGREIWYALDLLLVHVIWTLHAELQNEEKSRCSCLTGSRLALAWWQRLSFIVLNRARRLPASA
jgi:hypothetical protein